MSPSEDTAQVEPKIMDFDAVVEEHSHFVYNVAYRIMDNPEDAEDVVQDTLISAYRAFHRFRGESLVTTWLHRITTNAALMKLRSARLSRSLTQTGVENVEIADWNNSPERDASNSELGEMIVNGIARLEPNQRAAVVLRDVKQLTNLEAAKVIGISVTTLKSRLHRGRVLLRKYLSDYVAAPC